MQNNFQFYQKFKTHIQSLMRIPTKLFKMLGDRVNLIYFFIPNSQLVNVLFSNSSAVSTIKFCYSVVIAGGAVINDTDMLQIHYICICICRWRYLVRVLLLLSSKDKKIQNILNSGACYFSFFFFFFFCSSSRLLVVVVCVCLFFTVTYGCFAIWQGISINFIRLRVTALIFDTSTLHHYTIFCCLSAPYALK